MPHTKEFCIDIELSDGGKLIRADKARDFVNAFIIKRQERLVREQVQGLICFQHHNFPVVEHTVATIMQATGPLNIVVIRVRCCCEEFLNIVDKRFHHGQ